MSTYEEVTVLPFQPPSAQLLEMLRWYEETRADLVRVCAWVDWQHEELYGFGELTPLQVDRLLSR